MAQQAALHHQRQMLRSHLALQRSHNSFSTRGGPVTSSLTNLVKEQLSQAEKSHQQLVNLHYASVCGSHKREYQSLLLEHTQVQKQLRRHQGGYRGSQYKLQKLIFQLTVKHVKNMPPPSHLVCSSLACDDRSEHCQAHEHNDMPADNRYPPTVPLHPSAVASNLPPFASPQPYPPSSFVASQSSLPSVVAPQPNPLPFPFPTQQDQPRNSVGQTSQTLGPFTRPTQPPVHPLDSTQRSWPSAVQADEPSGSLHLDIQRGDSDPPPDLSYPPSIPSPKGEPSEGNASLVHLVTDNADVNLTGALGICLVEVASYVRLFEKVVPEVGGERVCNVCRCVHF